MSFNTKGSLKRLVVILTLISFILFVYPTLISAAGEVEGSVVTLGEDLTKEQETALLDEMGVSEKVDIIYVSNEEERQYLGQYIDATQIGSRAISSTKVSLTSSGTGIQVQTNHINWVTEAMYTNALATAGVKDAKVYVTAPFDVSGTAGLTGILKAFEVAADVEISEEQKQVANEEMVRTAELAEKIGVAKAAELVKRLKAALDDTNLETDEDYRNLVLTISAELNVELSEKDVEALVHLLKKLEGLDVNWEQVQDQLINIRDNLGDLLNREETKSLLRQFLDILVSLIERVKAIFA